jgi:hypothetical protein
MTQQTRPVDPPGPEASMEVGAQLIHLQLESLAMAGREVLQGLLFLEASSNRLQGGARKEVLCSETTCFSRSHRQQLVCFPWSIRNRNCALESMSGFASTLCSCVQIYVLHV